MKNVVITGADGFVGSNTVRFFLEQGIRVLALDISDTPNRLAEDPNLLYECCDVADTDRLETLLNASNYDTMIHFAWAASAGDGRMDYNLQMQNALSTVECLKMAKKAGIKRFVCAGSIMEYEVEAAMRTQGSKPGMPYIYGIGKQMAHSMCKCVAANVGIELIWPMITNTYGVGEKSPRFVNSTLRKIIHHEPLQFTAATQNYDFVYITDVARAFYLIALNGKPFCEYIIGSSNARPLREFILEMQKELAPDAIPIFGDVPFTGTNLPISAFDCSDTEKDTGFRAEITFAKGTSMTMNWLKENDREEK